MIRYVGLKSVGVKITILSSLLFLLSACGGGGGGATPATTSTAPVIANLSFSPTSVAQNFGGGSTTVVGTIDFIDKDGDLATLTVSDASGSSSISLSSSTAGLTAGQIAITSFSRTTTIGSFPFSVWVTDSAGNASNKLTGTFTVN